MLRHASIAVLALLPGLATAQDGVETVRLLPGWMAEDGRYIAALHIRLEPGWKTYWRTPGEGGIPPVMDWSGSTNVVTADPSWPTPTVFETYGMQSIGYERELLLPIYFETVPGARTSDLRLHLSFGVCADICIPAEATTSARMQLDQIANEGPILAALAQRAAPMEDAGISSVTCEILPADNGAWVLSATLDNGADMPDPAVVKFEAPNPDLWIAEAEVERASGSLIATARMDYFGDGPLMMARDAIRVNVITPRRVYEQTGC